MYGLIFLTGSSRTPQLGLDLRGGTTVTLTAKTPDGKAPAKEDLELARQIIEQRVNGLGVAEAEVVTEGSSNIVISVPGDNGEKARELGATAQLRFRPVLAGPEAATQAATDSASASASASGSATDSAAATPTDSAAASPTDSAAATPTGAVADPSLDPNRPPVTQDEAAAAYATLTCDTNDTTSDTARPDDYVAACTQDGTAKYLLGPTIIEGTDVTDASSGTQQTTGEWVVLLDFNNKAENTWAQYTAANVQKNVAFTLDGRVISAPTIQSAINSNPTTISGSFTQTTADELANQLKYGALPLTFSQATAESISTELGAQQ